MSVDRLVSYLPVCGRCVRVAGEPGVSGGVMCGRFLSPTFRYLWNVAAVSLLFGGVLLPHFHLLVSWSSHSLG